jgi:hypothetical protein
VTNIQIHASLVLALAGVVTGSARQPQIWPTSGWTKAAPDEHGISAARFADLARDVESGTYGNIDRLLVIRNGYLVVDQRYTRDYRAISRGRTGPLGCGEGCADPAAMNEFNYYHPNWHPYYQGRDIHTLQSVTKTIAATIVGIAIGRGEIANVGVPFLSFFRDRNLSGVDQRLHKATLQDLLTMRSGIEWHETDRPLNETNTTYQLEKSRDWIQFTLDQPMDSAPGTKWAYNSGGSQLLSGIVKTATGRFIDDYGAETLFRPLGIRHFHWKKTPTGHPDSEGGLYLSAEDLARIGLLYLRDGLWESKRILPEAWVRSATTQHVTGLAGGWGYGFQWWITTRNRTEIWAGRGFGGQHLIVIPSRHIVGVILSWNVFGGSARPIFEPFVSAQIEDK